MILNASSRATPPAKIIPDHQEILITKFTINPTQRNEFIVKMNAFFHGLRKNLEWQFEHSLGLLSSDLHFSKKEIFLFLQLGQLNISFNILF